MEKLEGQDQEAPRSQLGEEGKPPLTSLEQAIYHKRACD